MQNLQPAQSSQVQPGRDRFTSFETVSVDLRGPNDQSRQLGAELVEEQSDENGKTDEHNQAQRRPDAVQGSRPPGPGSRVTLRGTQYMHNIFTQLQDLQGKFEKNNQTVSADKQC